ncbi:MAG: hypothetical protein ABL876_08850 [Chitinophagaceae bacterium]
MASFFDDWNSWGYYNIHFEVKTSDSTYFIYKKKKDWPRNYPSFSTLFPGDSLSLSFTLSCGHCADSPFSGMIDRTTDHPIRIKALYQQSKDALIYANLTGDIKYKKIYKRSEDFRQRKGSWITVDSLKTAVEVNRTFPLSRLESKEYELK